MPIDVRPVFPHGRCLGGMKVNAALREVAISRGEAVEDHGAVGIRCFRRGLVIVSTNEVHLAGGPGKAIGRVEVA